MLCEDEMNETLCLIHAEKKFWESDVKRFIIYRRKQETVDSSARQRETFIEVQDEINVFNSELNQFW